jgi:hypothetical protein
MSININISIKQFRTNPIYAPKAYRDFIKSTTTTDVKHTLQVQAFWDKAFRIRSITDLLGTKLIAKQRKVLSTDRSSQSSCLELKNCLVNSNTRIEKSTPSAMSIASDFSVVKGKIGNASLSLGIEILDWHKDNFICAPGASYNAGRFERHRTLYPPFLPKDKWKRDIPIITSEIPGLSTDENHSQMDLLMSELCSPMIGIWLKKESKCIWIRSEQQSAIGENGISVREDLLESTLTLDVMTPIVRERTSSHGASRMPSWDKGKPLRKNDTASLGITLHTFPCQSYDDFYAAFGQLLRSNISQPVLARNSLPFSTAWDLIESLYNDKKWSAEHGYYHAGFLPPFIDADAWSAGWTGGLALSYALLNRGNKQSNERALKNLAFFFSEGGQSPSGVFYATSDGENWGGDNYFNAPSIGSKDWIHSRRCGDYLYFVIKHFRLLEARGQANLISDSWKEKTKRCADALCKVWRDNKHFGQYINPNTLEIRIGNSDAGTIIPAALAECSAYFDRADYLVTAEDSLEFYYTDYQKKGFTCGGPLEILCAPDSESAINLLESLVTVFERTKNPEWIERSLKYFNYIRTWFYSYDVVFPKGTAYQRRRVQTTGSVMASSQNRCGVPNICTLSGDVFWRLHRYTQAENVMQLIQECVHNTQQYISRKDNPIQTVLGATLPQGTIHECIQTGDWAGPTGEIPYEYPTSWAEVAHLLSICELPGIYFQSDDSRLFVIDHLDVEVIESKKSVTKLKISNPTDFDSSTTVYCENRKETQEMLNIDLMQTSQCINIPAKSSVIYEIDSNLHKRKR